MAKAQKDPRDLAHSLKHPLIPDAPRGNLRTNHKIALVFALIAGYHVFLPSIIAYGVVFI